MIQEGKKKFRRHRKRQENMSSIQEKNQSRETELEIIYGAISNGKYQEYKEKYGYNEQNGRNKKEPNVIETF